MDKYRHHQYTVNAFEADPFLADILTLDPAVRIHACDRAQPCDCIARRDQPRAVVAPHVPTNVFIHPREMSAEQWVSYHALTREQLTRAVRSESGAKWPTLIHVPLGRHSTLPELRSLVSLFEPDSVVPNSLPGQPRRAGSTPAHAAQQVEQEEVVDVDVLAYWVLPALFSGTLSYLGQDRILADAQAWMGSSNVRKARATYVQWATTKGVQAQRSPSPALAARFLRFVLAQARGMQYKPLLAPDPSVNMTMPSAMPPPDASASTSREEDSRGMWGMEGTMERIASMGNDSRGALDGTMDQSHALAFNVTVDQTNSAGNDTTMDRSHALGPTPMNAMDQGRELSPHEAAIVPAGNPGPAQPTPSLPPPPIPPRPRFVNLSPAPVVSDPTPTPAPAPAPAAAKPVGSPARPMPPPHEQPVAQPIRPQRPLVAYPSSRPEAGDRNTEVEDSAAQTHSRPPSAHCNSHAVAGPDAEPPALVEPERSWTHSQPAQQTRDEQPNDSAANEHINGHLADQTKSFSVSHVSAAVLAPQTSVSQLSSADLVLPSSDQVEQQDLLGQSNEPVDEVRYDPASDSEEESRVPDPAPTGSPCARTVMPKRKWISPEQIQQRADGSWGVSSRNGGVVVVEGEGDAAAQDRSPWATHASSSPYRVAQAHSVVPGRVVLAPPSSSPRHQWTPTRPTTPLQPQPEQAVEGPAVQDVDQVLSHPLVVSASLLLLDTTTGNDKALNASSSMAISNWGRLASAYSALATACNHALCHPASQSWTKLKPDRTRLIEVMQEHTRATVDVLSGLYALAQEDTVFVLTVLGTLIPLVKCLTMLHHLQPLPPSLARSLAHLDTQLGSLVVHPTYGTAIQLPMYAIRQLLLLLPSTTSHALPSTSPGHPRGPRTPTHTTPALPHLSRKRPRAAMAIDDEMLPLEDGPDLLDHPPPTMPSPPLGGSPLLSSPGVPSSPDLVRNGRTSPVLSNVSSPIAISPRGLALHSSRYISFTR